MGTYALTRASTLKQVDSQKVQRKLIEAACKSYNLGEPVFLDEELGTSGVKKTFAQREKGYWILQNLGQNDILVVSRIDRLGRGWRDIGQTVEQLADRGVRIVVVASGGQSLDLSSANGKFMARLFILIAQYEADLISERTRDAAAWRKENGLPVAGRPAFCKQHVQNGSQRKTVEWDLPMLEQVVFLAGMRSAGRSWDRLLAECAARQFRSADGRQWWCYRHKPDTSPAVARRKRFGKIQQAMNWLYREMHARRLPEPFQSQVKQMGVPRGVRLNPLKRRSRKHREANPNGNGSATTNDPTPIEMDTWTRDDWASWWKERQRAEG